MDTIHKLECSGREPRRPTIFDCIHGERTSGEHRQTPIRPVEALRRLILRRDLKLAKAQPRPDGRPSDPIKRNASKTGTNRYERLGFAPRGPSGMNLLSTSIGLWQEQRDGIWSNLG
jgi:hypothetical protein